MGNLKAKVYKTYSHNLEELTSNIYQEFSTISGEKLQILNNNTFHKCTECFQSGRQHFQHLLSTGELSLDFLKFIVTAVLCVGPFIDSYHSSHPAYNAVSVVHAAATYL
jgi:hypothetical protein